MEPVELDFIYGGNTDTEGKKIVMTLEQIAAASDATKAKFERHQVAIVELKKDLVSLGTAYKQATTKEGKSQILEDIELTKKNLIDEKHIAQQLKAEMTALSRVKVANVTPNAAAIQSAAKSYNGLNMSVNQVVRELPAATMGLNMFFLAISNNIPIMTDNIKRARLENEALKASGQSTTPVWKQLLSSLVSWQTLMMVGITVVSMYGKKIFQAFSKGSEAADRAKEDAKKFNETFSTTAGESLAKVNQLSSEWKGLGDNMAEKKKFVDENKSAFQQLGVEINNVKDAENLLVDNVDAFRQAMIAKAMSVAAMQTATLKYQEYFKQMSEAEKIVPEKPGAGDKFVSALLRAGASEDPTADFSQTSPIVVARERKNKAVSTANAIKAEGDALISESNKQNDLYDEFLEKAGIKRYERQTKTREKAQKEAYNSERDFLNLIYDLHVKSDDMLLGLQADSLAKRLAEIEAEKQAELAAIQDKEIAIIEAYNKSNKDKKGFTALSTKPGDIGASLQVINPEQAALLEQQVTNIISSYGAKSVAVTKKWNDEIAKLALEFSDQRIKIAEEYNAKITKLAESGQKEAADAARKERDKKIGEETVSLLKETELYKMATDDQLNLTVASTEALLDLLRHKMVDAWADGKMTVEQMNQMMDQVNKVQDKIQSKKNQNNPFSHLNTAINNNKSAQSAYTAALSDPSKTTEQLAELESAAANATQNVAAAAGAALQGVNSILGSVVNGLDELGMLTEEEKKTANEVMGMVGGAANIAMGLATGNPMQIIQGSIDLIVNGIKLFDEKSKSIERAQKLAKKNLEDLAREYDKLGRAVENALGTDIYTAQRKQIDNLRAQINENQRLITEELKKSKKKQDAEAIANWQAEIDNLKSQIGDTVDAITESLAGTNAKDLASQLSDALITAFQNGESAAQAMGNTVNDVLRNAVTNALKLQFLEKPMQKAVEDLAKSMEDGALSTSESKKFEDQIKAAGEQYYSMLAQYSDLFTASNTSGSASGIKGDVAKMTEETGTALTGQITAIRLNIVSLLTQNKSGIDIMAQQLAVMHEIKNYASRLDRIDETLYYMKVNGITLK